MRERHTWYSRLAMAQVASCTCETKTPEIRHHDEMCHFRLFSEAYAALSPLQVGYVCRRCGAEDVMPWPRAADETSDA